MNLKYDRLNGMKSDEETFDLICPTCLNDALKIHDLFKVHIIGVSTKNIETDNSDLPKEFRAQYDNLPTVRDCLLQHTKDNEKQMIQFICKNCGAINTHNTVINKTRIRKWADKHYPEILKL